MNGAAVTELGASADLPIVTALTGLSAFGTWLPGENLGALQELRPLVHEERLGVKVLSMLPAHRVL